MKGSRSRGMGVGEIEKFVKEIKSGLSEKSGDIKLWAPRECSWALQEACKVRLIHLKQYPG
jgi:hypothetical protein